MKVFEAQTLSNEFLFGFGSISFSQEIKVQIRENGRLGYFLGCLVDLIYFFWFDLRQRQIGGRELTAVWPDILFSTELHPKNVYSIGN